MADRRVSDDAITQLTRNLFDERQKLTADAPVARLVQAASTDKDAIFPVHPGAKVFYDGEEKTLMERYGDWLFYGPMLLGMLGTVLAAMLRFLGLPQVPDRRSSCLGRRRSLRRLRRPARLQISIQSAAPSMRRSRGLRPRRPAVRSMRSRRQ